MVAVEKKRNGASGRYRIQTRTARMLFGGTIYEGAEVVVRLDVSVGLFVGLQDLIAEEKQLLVFYEFGEKVLQSWNLEDDDGMPYPASGDGMNSIPIALATIILQKWVEEATQLPDPLEVS